MSKYQDFLKEARMSGKGNGFSKNEMVALATAMFNDPDVEIPIYAKKGEGYEAKPMTPSKDLREKFVAPIVKSFGVDRAEMAKLEDIQTSRAGGEALTDFALLLIKQYISANGLGRKLTLPMTSPAETVQSIGTVQAPEEKRATTMIARNDDGSYSTTPTGKVVTTKGHEKLKVGNRVPVWLKATTDA